MAPPSQRYRQIGFYLEGGDGQDVKLDLAIRPEELTVSEPSRLIVQQTLGGAWADSFDRGLVSINLSGTLGWRGSLLLSGEDAFAQLRQTVFLDWHKRRKDALAAGNDPATVKLTFIDTLDSLTYVVAPQQFSLRRSKSAPLLMRYQIRLAVLDDADGPSGIIDQIISALSNPLRWLAGVTGLGGVLTTIQGYISTGLALYGAASTAVRSFVGMISGVLNSVASVASDVRGEFSGLNGDLLTTARSLCQAGSNALSALATDPTLPDYLLIPARRLPSLLTEADCTMANSFSLGRSYTSFDDLYGASNCSSTGGGLPPSPYAVLDSNPFDDFFPATASLIGVSEAASAALGTLQVDPLQLLGRDAFVARQLSTIAVGVTV